MTEERTNPYVHPLIAEKVFPVVDVSAKRIEYPRGNWGESSAPLTRWQREAARLRRRVRWARRHAAQWLAGDQWPTLPEDDPDW